MPQNEGDLGLIKVNKFIEFIKLKCYGNPLIADENTFSRHENPYSTIYVKFSEFLNLLLRRKTIIIKKALIFRNQFFRRGRHAAGNFSFM
jgi:hypothetical protein